MTTTEYESNNSGGDWWLTDDDWYKLEAAGWKVNWVKDQPNRLLFVDPANPDRWLGALATSATRDLPLDEAIEEWENVVGQSPDDEGCECCGQPHNFYQDRG